MALNIQKRVDVTGGLFLGFLLLVAIIFGIVVNGIFNDFKRETVAEEILSLSSDLNILTYDYSLRRNERSFRQWQSTYAAMESPIFNAQCDCPDDLATLSHIRSVYEEIGSLFSMLSKEVELEGGELRLKDSRLTNLLLLRSRSMLVDTSNLVDTIRERMRNKVYWLVGLIIIALFVLSAFCFDVYLYMQRFVLRPLRELKNGAERFEKGNVDYSLTTVRNDEFGDLTVSFNSMLKELRSAYSVIVSRSQEKEMILQQMAAALIVLDEDGCLVKINDRALTLLNYKNVNLIGRKFSEFSNFVDENGNLKISIDDLIERVVSSKKSLYFEDLYLVKSTGAILSVDFAASQLVGEGNASLVVLIFRDSSEQTHKRKVSNEFLSMASHQLRTPLTVIDWYSKELLSGHLGPIADRQREYLKEIKKGNRRVVDLLDRLADLSRYEEGNTCVQDVDFNLLELLDSIILEYELEAKARKVNVVYESNCCDVGSVDAVVKGKRAIILVIIQNLVSNAVRYSRESGRVSILCFKREDMVCVSVKDYGIGIPKSEHHLVFSKLYRASNARSMSEPGNGLGLYLVKLLVELCKGTITFRSVEGEGSTFTFCFPIK